MARKAAYEWEPILQNADVPAAHLRGLPEALESSQIQGHGFVQTTDDGTAVPTLTFRLGWIDAYVPVSADPSQDLHTADILEWLKAE